MSDHRFQSPDKARISEEIAGRLDAPTIAQRSPGFKGFLGAVMNGSSHDPLGNL